MPDPVIAEDLYPTHGPKNRFGAILFIEKEGFEPLLQAVQLAERYDVAVMSTKGMSITAARQLVDELCLRHKGVPLLIVRDFDKAGFSIGATLQSDTRRYTFKNATTVHHFGLRLADVKAWKLESEMVSYGKSDPRSNLRKNGATRAEIAFLYDDARSYPDNHVGRRVELNAFTSGQFVTWLEAKLNEHRIQKVIPNKEILADAYRRQLIAARMQERLVELQQAVENEVSQSVIPHDLAKRVAGVLKKNPELPWDLTLRRLIEK